MNERDSNKGKYNDLFNLRKCLQEYISGEGFTKVMDKFAEYQEDYYPAPTAAYQELVKFVMECNNAARRIDTIEKNEADLDFSGMAIQELFKACDSKYHKACGHLRWAIREMFEWESEWSTPGFQDMLIEMLPEALRIKRIEFCH